MTKDSVSIVLETQASALKVYFDIAFIINHYDIIFRKTRIVQQSYKPT